jgi:hypothetical protein
MVLVVERSMLGVVRRLRCIIIIISSSSSRDSMAAAAMEDLI